MKGTRLLHLLFLLFTFASFAQETTAGEYTINILDANSEKSDFGTTFYGDDKIIFSSSRGLSRMKWDGNGQAFLDLYEGDIQDDGSVKNVRKFSSRLNSKYHESSVSFSPDQKTVYFTRNNYLKRKLEEDKTGTINLAIYRAKVDAKGVWSNIESLPFNSKDYSTGHPTVSRDGKRLFFSSDMPGTYGMSDIYVVDIHEDGTFSQPKNLGRKINTSGRESFLYIDKNNILYFSSDSHKHGLGNLDIYATKIYTKSVSKAVHLGSPINTEYDDFAFIINNKTNEGYFSSNREEGGIGFDDIYHFKAEPPLYIACKQKINGIVLNKKTGKSISKALVTFLDENDKQIDTYKTKRDGKFHFNGKCDVAYKIKASKDEFSEDSSAFVTEDDPDAKPNIKLALRPKEVAVVSKPAPVVVVKPPVIKPNFDEIKVVRNKVIVNINPIYFSLNQANIRKDAARELDKVVAIMKKYPALMIEGGSHTDSRGGDAYNIKLSTKRAKSTVNYIIKHGIDASRITAKGYGESQPTNRCTNGVRCSEKEHQQNRRTEFVILNPEVLGYKKE